MSLKDRAYPGVAEAAEGGAVENGAAEGDAVEDEVAEEDPYHVNARKAALHAVRLQMFMSNLPAAETKA